ncbi:MAG TPA: hypothetical protein VK849_12160, partial [Longimicrobiales bacterium]|nr:hypothetical protein [Longimicrobiales bacterium]
MSRAPTQRRRSTRGAPDLRSPAPGGEGVTLAPGRAALIPGGLALVLLLFGWVQTRVNVGLLGSFVAAAAVLAAWTAALVVSASRGRRGLTLQTAIYRHHWVQACAQSVVFVWWAWHVRIVLAFLPLLVAQVIFAYGVDALLNWTRRGRWAAGFGPVPVVFSINLFLWFRPEWFVWQFAMILVGFLAKELIRWQRDGRSAHIFNPSSFPLAVVSLALIANGASEITFGSLIANTQSDPPYIYLVIFLASLPGQFLFGVARMTLPAVATMYLISLAYFQATGTYLFFDSHIPVPVFLGMHLLFTDPSTSPRSESGRVVFGVIYGLATTALFVILGRLGVPTFYDKLLPVPFMNLMVRRIDLLAASRPFARLDPARIVGRLGTQGGHAAYTVAWAALFAGMSAVQGVGDRHPGQYLPFWQDACQAGNERACRYSTFMKLTYCNNGSGWACNEWGIEQPDRPQAAGAFRRACELGFTPGCENTERAESSVGPASRASPAVVDLPILLRGTKLVVSERDPARL